MRIIRIEIESAELQKTWDKYKEYLLNEHGIIMNAEDEILKLDKLNTIAGGSEKKAIKVLELCVLGCYKQLVDFSLAKTFYHKIWNKIRSIIDFKQLKDRNYGTL